jgi:hypothetical protein
MAGILSKNSAGRIHMCFSQWYKFLLNQDFELIQQYCSQMGYFINFQNTQKLKDIYSMLTFHHKQNTSFQLLTICLSALFSWKILKLQGAGAHLALTCYSYNIKGCSKDVLFYTPLSISIPTKTYEMRSMSVTY